MATLIARAKQTRRTVKRRDADPWRTKLESLRGIIGADGHERIASQGVADFLELPKSKRNHVHQTRIIKLMSELGWQKCKARGLRRGAYNHPLNGFVREPNHLGAG